jgi:glycosyltransferase involved in cell wall biosynthesis
MIGPSAHETINAVERGLPVADWSVDGLRVWPIVRYLLGAELGNRWRLPAGEVARAARQDRGRTRALRLAREYAGWARARIADRRNHQSLGRTYDALFVQIFPRPLCVDGQWMCPIAEPFRQHFAALDLDMLVLDVCGGVRGYPIPRYAPTRHVSFEDRLALRIRHGLYRRPEQVHLSGFSSLSAFLASWPGARVPDEAAVLDVVRTVRIWSDYFRRVIARTRPRIGFVPYFSAPTAFAFVLACHDAGIPSVNLQHGCQGPEHVGFGSWSAIPPGGYELLPSYFWCWSRADTEVIESWTSNLTTHIPIHGGNPWINMWKRLRDRREPAVRQGDVAADPSRTHVVYSFPPEPRIPDAVLDVIRASPDSWVWWLRLHPSRPAGAEREVREQLSGLANVHVEVERATDMPLFDLLHFADVHVTLYSTVVQEAAAFGVPSVIVSPIGERYYGDVIAAGLAVMAMEPDTIRAAIERLAEQPRAAADDSLHLSEEAEAQVFRRLLVRAGVLDAARAGVLDAGRPPVLA